MATLPFSWSKVSAYETCPRQYYEVNVAKNYPQDWESEYLVWGNAVHKAMELNLTEQKPLEGRFEFLIPLANKINAIPGDHYGEQKLAIDVNLNPVDYWDKSAWARCIIDRLIVRDTVAMPLDYKSGKRKPYSRQLALNTVTIFSNFPQVEVSHTAYLWTQGGKPTQKTFTRKDIPEIVAGFAKNIDDMLWSEKNNAWPAKPSGLCGPNRSGTYAGCVVLDCPHNRRPDAIKKR